MTDANQTTIHSPSVDDQMPELFGHPKGLFYLFFAELWERFSFYGMRALLTLYMVKELFVALENRDTLALSIYASYGTLVYGTPIIGGFLADKFLGYRRAIILGAILMALGHLVMTVEHPAFFYGALALLILGNGFFKPNISSFVGSMYEQGDTRRDSGFTIFYMGINIGAASAPLICGWLAYEFGWHYGFGAATLGMISGLIVFWNGIKTGVFGQHGLPPNRELIDKPVLGLKLKIIIPVLAFLFVPPVAYAIFVGDINMAGIYEGTLVSFVFKLILVAVIGYIIYIFYKVSSKERARLVTIFFLTMLMTLFWAFYELSGSLITLFADRNINLIMFTASGTNSITAIYVVILALPFSLMWVWLTRKKINPFTPYKFALGLAFIGLGFYIFSMSSAFADNQGMVPFVFMALGYLWFVVGELLMSPVGLSKITELSPKEFVGFFMGVWFLASSFAFDIGGFIGRQLAISAPSGKEIGGFDSLYIYTDGFEQIAYVAFIGSLVALIFAPFVKKWMHGIH